MIKPDKYDAWYKRPFGAYADRLEKRLVFQFLGDVNNRKILDVGCGTGNYCIPLAKKGAEVTGIDSSREMISRAKEKAEKEDAQVRFYIGKAERLPFDSKTFDIVLSITACEFLENIQEAVEEMKRVVKDNGKIVIGLINKRSIYCFGKRVMSRFKEDSVYARAKFYNAGELKKMFGEEVRWESTLFAQEWFPPSLLKFFGRFEEQLSKLLRPFGAFIVLEINKEDRKR